MTDGSLRIIENRPEYRIHCIALANLILDIPITSNTTSSTIEN